MNLRGLFGLEREIIIAFYKGNEEPIICCWTGSKSKDLLEVMWSYIPHGAIASWFSYQAEQLRCDKDY